MGAEPEAADPATETKPEGEAPAEPEQKVEKKKSGSFLRGRNKTPEKKAPEPPPPKEVVPAPSAAKEVPAPPPAKEEPPPAQEVAKKKSGSFLGAKAKAPETSSAPVADAIAAPEQKAEKKKSGSFFKQGGKGSAPSKSEPAKQPEAITEEDETKGGEDAAEEKQPKKKGSFFQKKEKPDEVDETISVLKASEDRSAEGGKKAKPQPPAAEKKSLKFTGKKDSSINSPAPELGDEEEVPPPKKGGLFACCMGGGGVLEESMQPTRGIDKKGSVFAQKTSRKSTSIEVAITMNAANATKDIPSIKARKALVHGQRNEQGADMDVTVKSSHKTTSLYFGEALKKKGKGAAVKALKKDDVRTKIKTAVRADVEEFETSRATVFEQQLLLYDVLWSCLKEKFDEGEQEVTRAISGLESYKKVLGLYASGLTNVKEMALPTAADDGDEPAPLNDLSELVASWQGHVGAAANDLVAIVNAGILEKEVAAAQDALTTCTQDLTYDSEESVALLKHTSVMVKAAHEKFLTSVNQHLGDSGMHTATEDDDIHELDVKDDLWLLDVNYRCATGALHDVFVDTRETFAAVLGDFKAAEAKRLEAIQRASSAFANAQKDMLPGVEQIVIDHAKHGGKATTKGESEIQEDLMNQVQAAIMAVQDTAAARMITMEAIEAAASPTAGDALLNGLAPLDAPLSTPLVISAVVFEAKHAKWPTKDQWCNVLGVRTRDKYMHLFFLSGEFDASLSAEDALRQITPALELKHDKKGKATAPKVNAKTIKPDFTLSVADSGGQADQTMDDGAIIKITESIKKKERLLSVRGLPDTESEFWKTHVSATAAAAAATTA